MKYLCGLICLLAISGCKIGLNQASIPVEMKTVTVRVFENNAPLVVATLSTDFTEELKTRIRNQTRLRISTGDADGVFSGNITGYSITPEAITDNNRPTAGATRLTIRVSVKYTNNINPKQSFEQTFEKYKVYKQGGGLIQEQSISKDVRAMLTEDIFNAAFAQW